MLPMAALSLPPVGVYCSGGGATPNSSISNNNLLGNHALDAAHIQRAAELADGSAGFTSPHPNFGCVIASKSGKVAGEGFLYAQGTKPAEVLAVDAAGDFSRRATAYLNMEPGDCHGDHSAVSALVQAGIERVVIGLRHPLQHLRGNAIRALRSQGLQVDFLGEDLNSKLIEEARKSCLLVNAPLICRAASRVPFSVLKYAMTLDGKIAASSGHAAWISSKTSRNRVFELRGRSDAVIVGGNTVRKDNPRLTARHGGGHMPMRIVMSQTLDLPEEAHLWDTSDVSTIVATQRGARRHFQKHLASKGIEVVEFDILNPKEVMEYFHDRGYLSLLWECGGTLAAAAISSGVIHKAFAFVAPKIIGGKNAPSPVGELGMVEMTQAFDLVDVCYEQIGPDMLISGFLQPIPDVTPVIPSVDETFEIDPTVTPYESRIILFYKTWDPYGAFSNFSPHQIKMPNDSGDYATWLSVEHYYQAQKFVGVDDPVAQDCVENIKSARSPEEAARIGRSMQRKRPDLVRCEWESVKIEVMYRALKCKFSIYPHLNAMLLSSAGCVLVEASPHDLFWGGGRDGEGLNYLGRLLMRLRSEFLVRLQLTDDIDIVCACTDSL
ncbi:riboflavin biosynthesis protein PYRR [Pyrus ussuriensis x Pyrus communis]|uniref:Riboflavin biosynthesis protein PYRR, chloroplastic n=1 Tax=Pyrus ussuriensis x Pyrus communis TaxID=2448454 RepID=A0A5N5HV19_9ROSA|nr:riboflavin biosynthesis protein PYRR [Pyrus ussuriensis x Pyrus communis]